MAQLDRIAQAAFKKLFGLGHTEVKGFPIGNESDSSAITTIGRDIYTDTIGGSAGAVAGIIADCTNATDGTATSRLTLTVNPADTAGEGVAYYATVPASHGLLSEINPNTGALFQVGDRVSTIVPKKFGSTWRPIVYAAGPTEIPPLDVSDWFLDEKAGIVYFGTAPSSTPVRLGCYVYVGRTVSNLVTSAITALTGDVTAIGPGSVAATIANNAVTLAKMADMATASFLGRNTAATGDPEVLSIATAKTMLNLTGTNSGDQTITLTGDVTGSGVGSFAATIANDAVTYAKIQNVTTARLLGRATAGSGDVEEITLGTNLSFTGTTLNAAGGLTDGDKGDITVSGSGAAWAIDAGVVTLAKMADMATDSFLGRDTAGTGAPEVLSVATAKTLLNLTGTNSGDQTITLTGDVTGSGTGSFAATIANNAVTLAKMADMATLSVIGRSTAGTGDPEIIDAGSDFQVLRRSGTTLDFGSINLASANAVTGTLGVGNGGTGTATTFTAGSVIFAGASGVYSQSNADFFWDNTKKFISFGHAAPQGVLDIQRTMDGAGASGYTGALGLQVRVINTPTAAQTDRPAWGINTVLQKEGSQNVTATYIPMRAMETSCFNNGTGSVLQMVGNVAQIGNFATGVVTEAIYFYSYIPTVSAANPITTIYGLKVDALKATGITTAYSIYCGGASDRNYLGGTLHVRPALAEPGSYSLTSWNGTGQVISLYARGMTDNGGTTPNAAEPVLVLARDSTIGVVYGSTVEFKMRRWETGNAPRSSTAMDIALTDGSGPAAGTDLISFLSNGCIGIRTAQPQAALHLPAGTATARTAPLMFTTGTSLTTPVAGAMEYTTDNLFFTISTGTARKRLLMAEPVGGLTSGRVPFVTTNGRLTDSANLIFDGSKFTTYNGIASEAFGIPLIVDDVALTGQVANIASTAFTNANVAGTYQLNYYLIVTTAQAGGGSLFFDMIFNDGTSANIFTGTAVAQSALGSGSGVSFIRLGSGSVSYSVTLQGGTYGTTAYSLYCTLMRLS